VGESESSLVAQAVQGDRDALAALLEQHAPALRRNSSLAMPRRWQSLLSIDDVLQQTFTDAVFAVRRFVPRPGASFGGWLATLARRNLQDVIRMLEAAKRGGRSQPVRSAGLDESYDGLFDLLLDSSTTPSRHVAQEEIGALLDRAIDTLPQDYRATVRMCDLEGRSVEDVATSLGRTTGAVYMLRARAHRWLREILGQSSDFFGNSSE
jgi:RNA polymerase sigma-70 factor (ECF subfamily)